MKRFIIFWVFSVFACTTFAQVVIIPVPHQEGYFTLEDLWRVNIVSTNPQATKVQLEVQLENAQHQLVLSAISPEFTLLQGTNRPTFNTAISRTQFGSTPAAGILRSTGRLPYGSYIVCYRALDTKSNGIVGQYCQEETSKPFSPPELISPYDREEISTTFPILTWKPPFPPGAIPFEYTIRLVEVKTTQSALEALERNPPLLSRRGIYVTAIPYPGDAWKLQSGKTYAWQVSAKAGEFELGVTEVWTFKITDKAEAVSISTSVAYRALQLAPEGSYYPVIQKLKFVYPNRYGAPGLRYDKQKTTGVDSVYFQIYTTGINQSPVSMTESKILLHGVNRISIDLQSVAGIINEENYIMIIRDPNGKEYFLEFKYFD